MSASLAAAAAAARLRLAHRTPGRGAVLPVVLLSVLAPRGAGAATTAAPAPVVRLSAPAGVNARAWPVWSGVPFPPGRLRDPADLRLLEIHDDARRGAPVRVQVRPLVRWPDGSIRWAGVDWQADLTAGRERRFVVETAAGAAAAAPGAGGQGVRIAEGPERIEVDTGALRFAVPRTAAGFLADVRRAAAPAAAPARLSGHVRVAGLRHAAQAPESVAVTERGPLRTRVEIRGGYTASLRYVVRIDAYAGHAFVRILHSLEQHGAERHTPLEELALEIAPLPGGTAATWRAGRADGAPWNGPVPSDGITLLQEDNETVRVGEARLGARAAGWLDATGAGGGVAVAGRYFWQEYPQGFIVRPGALVYQLRAPVDPPALVGMGAAKTHELVLLVHDGAPPEPAVLDFLRAPAVAPIEPRWIRTSGALPNAVDPDAGAALLRQFDAAARRAAAWAAAERWDDSQSVRCAAPARERPRRGFYGMLNWGDWNFPGYHDSVKGCDAWGNLEYDLAQVHALAWAATGDARHHDAMVAAARHYMDVDRIHFHDRHPGWVGMNHPKNPLHFSFELGGVDLGHTWNEGLVSYFVLTGDERGLAAARGIADYLVRRIGGRAVRGNPRQWGWPQIALVAAYEATGHGPYREAALAYARGGMAAHAPAPLDHWKLGILADGLAYTHALTGAPEILAWLRRYADAWRAAEGANDARFLPGAAYVAMRTADEALRARVLDRVAGLQLGGWAKPLTIGGRTAFRVHALLGPAPPGPRPGAPGSQPTVAPPPAPPPETAAPAPGTAAPRAP